MKHGGMSPGMGSSSPWLWTKQSRNKQDEDKAVKESEMSVRWSIRLKLEEEDTFERQELPVL